MEKKYFAVGVVCIFGICAVILLVLFVPHTAEFRKRFIKKCEEYPQKSHSCQDIWETFEKAYVNKNPLNFSETNYDPLFEKILFTHPRSQTMLWSGTKGLVHDFTKKRGCFFTLEDTLLGSLLDNQQWCGLKGSKETFAFFCTIYKNNNPVISFWKNASRRFALYATGEVTAMLNGGLKKPYDPKSIFASIEVKTLQSPRVKRLNVILLTDNNSVKKCNTDASLQNLKNELYDKGISYTCRDVTRSHIRKCINENYACGTCW
ncbi:ADP-ribosyl cyclase/cyclic ADP-ribose hydrolase 1-like [Plectropomus leopardus]|uniref:ADP-ribosyl cyclase/cyclic ADP-ribose hydrolase 1-like n=1 Tax=Plectropomus leopardus TaxID=160734 RepID=UPI001C4C4EAB|nr:ADP-ribosyl cyclase/cyclic ADP-ribose hydrolase 1-like [Plectropomus leopardus]